MRKKVKKLIKVTVEYNDGTIRVLDKRCDEWESECNSAIFMNWTHGHSVPDFPWKEIRGDPDENKK